MKQFFTKYKYFFKKAVALICAFSICCLLVVFAFSVPIVHATSYADQMEDYIDSYFGEGSSFVVEEILDEIADSGGSSGKAVYWGVMFALNAIETPEPVIVPVDSMTTLSGYYYNGGVKHYCVTPICSDESYTNSAGGVVIAASDQFTLRSLITCNTDITTRQASASTAQGYLYGAFSVSAVWANDRRFTQDVTGGGQVFNDFVSPANGWQVRYGVSNNNIPAWGNGTSPIEAVGFSNAGTSIAAYFDPYTSRVNWSDFGISEDIDLSAPADWVVNYFNEWFIQEYPDDTEIMFIPVEDPTEETTGEYCCQCHCYHEINVHVEPTINVYVENQFPSEWVEDYTIATDPVETFIEPTMPTVEETQEETLPTFELDDDVVDGLGFWRELWNSAMHATDFIGVITALLLLSIAEWALWHVGR